jgi:hypothetical protein
MELIFKRLANVFSVIITSILFFGLGSYFKNSDLDLWQFHYKLVAICYLIIFAFNYVLLGTATLWHKNVNKKIF